MNSILQFILIMLIASIFFYLFLRYIKKLNKTLDEKVQTNKPKFVSVLVYEKAGLDISIRDIEENLSYEKSEISRILIHEQLGLMRRYSNVLAMRIALSGKQP